MKLPARALSNFELEDAARLLEIPYFRGVFMRNALPSQPRPNESAIVNLDDKNGPGTHWVAYKKRGRFVNYFDSYGNLQPPRELISYLCTGSNVIEYNTTLSTVRNQ